MNNVAIYGLIDPRDNEVKYVGQTVNLMRRLKQHLADKDDTAKCDWIKELHLQGMKPQLVRLDTTTKEEAHAVENWWILFCRHQGWQNVNGTNPSEWRADFGQMFSEDLERQYQEYVARLESAESGMVKRHNLEIVRVCEEYEEKNELDAVFNNGVLIGKILFFSISTTAWLIVASEALPKDTIPLAILLIIAGGIIKLVIASKFFPSYFDRFGEIRLLNYKKLRIIESEYQSRVRDINERYNYS